MDKFKVEKDAAILTMAKAFKDADLSVDCLLGHYPKDKVKIIFLLQLLRMIVPDETRSVQVTWDKQCYRWT